METTHVRPAEGLSVATPDGGRLPRDGATVNLTTYWARRIACGDVVVVEPPDPRKTPPAPAAKRRRSSDDDEG